LNSDEGLILREALDELESRLKEAPPDQSLNTLQAYMFLANQVFNDVQEQFEAET
jgi:hypothetical protein